MVGHCYVGYPANYKVSFSLIMRFQSRSKIFLHNIHVHWWHKFAIGQHRYTVSITRNTRKFFNVTIPRCYIFITYGPVNPMPVFAICFKINIRPPIALPPPHKRAPTNVIAPEPIKGFYFLIWTFCLISPKVDVPFVHPLIFNSKR
ncbi:hypothetical protein D3C73_598510 [compost metagenome]